ARRHLQSLHIFLLSSTTTTDIYTLSLHDALPISSAEVASDHRSGTCGTEGSWYATRYRHSRTPLDTKSRSRCAISPRHYPIRLRSEEHTSELQSLAYLVCRLLLEKKKKKTQKHT